MSFATVATTNMEMTPMRVTFTPNGGTALDLGGTLDNVVITIAYKKSPIMADQYGKTELDARVSGVDFKVTTSLAEVQNVSDIWTAVFPNATLVPGGTGFSGKVALDFLSAIGGGSFDKAGELLLHPLSQADSVKDYDFTFYKVCSSEESEITYAADGQAKLKIVWKVYPDISMNPAPFFRHGDAALVP